MTFNWTADGVVVDDWQLLVGTSAGDNSLFDSGVLASTTLSAVVSGLLAKLPRQFPVLPIPVRLHISMQFSGEMTVLTNF